MGGNTSSLSSPPSAKTAGVAAAALVVAVYAQRTARSLRAHHAALSRQEQRPRVRDVLRYTLWGQFFAATQLLLGAFKPSLGWRVLRPLVWRPRDAVQGVAYGPHWRNTLDLYGVDIARKKPVVVFVHGGTWTRGRKEIYAPVGECLAAKGALVAVVNYRTFPTGSAFEMADDVDQAVLWVIDHCSEFGGDASRVFMVGHSAGAHLSALALTLSGLRLADADAVNKQREIARAVVGFVGLAGPYHLADHYEFERHRVLGLFTGIHEISATKPSMLGERNFDRLSPTALIEDAVQYGSTLKLPPFYLLHGYNEEVVPTSSSKRLAAALRQAGQHVEYTEVSNCTHFEIVFAAMGESVDCRDTVLERISRVVFV